MNAPLPAGVLTDSPGWADPEVLADCARAYEDKLRRLPQQVDPASYRMLVKRWPILDVLDDPVLVSRCLVRIVYGSSPLKPSLLRLSDPHAPLAFLDREDLLRNLCSLALARRLGVLRCCIDRQARDALRVALGDAFEPLRAMSASGRAMAEAYSGFTPLHWACVGYADWCLLMHPEDRALRRLVRLSLPRAVLVKLTQEPPVQADISAEQGVARLQEAGLEWPC